MNYKPDPISFIFTLNANEDEPDEDPQNALNDDILETFPEGGQTEKYFKCLCYVVHELAVFEGDYF